jgi:hypothetical protein
MSEIHIKHVEAEFIKLKDELVIHKVGILEKLQAMLIEL